MNELERDLAGVAASHRAIEASLHTLTDAQAASPSLLPGWTVGHVLSHIARNADSFVLMLDGARRGEIAAQYPGGREQRNADIDAGAGRSAKELVDDIVRSNAALEASFAATADHGWVGEGDSVLGRIGVGELPFRRWRETVVHHADAGLGFACDDWPNEYVRIELQRMTMLWDSRASMGLTGLPSAALAVPPHTRLAWLMGRTEIDGLEPAGLMG
ncbi:MAG: maleylpyruvate isomerase N-terminal domain-containing protein [Actinomycetota bacterium]